MYNKLFTKILDSSIWLEPTTTRLIWMTLIAVMDEDGFCQFASVANLAYRARVDLADTQAAVTTLESPDPDSSDPDNEGRRIERVPGGWIVLNAGKYREIVTRAVSKEQTRIRVQRHRDKKKQCNAGCNGDVTQSEAAAETKSETPTPKGVCEGKNSSLLPTTPQSKRIATLFNRKFTTAWSEREVAAYKKLGTIPEEDLAAIERYYASERAKGDDGVHRRDLGTFLNNFAGELDRAKAATISKNGKSTADTEPEGWREWCASKGYPVGEFRYAKDWIKSEFRRAGK